MHHHLRASSKLDGYERFLDHAVNADGDLIEEAMMMGELEPINLNQVMNDSNYLAAMEIELKEIEKKKT